MNVERRFSTHKNILSDNLKSSVFGNIKNILFLSAMLNVSIGKIA
jgi:hypothetical protein